MIIVSQCIHMSKYYIVHCKYIQCLVINYTSIKMEKESLGLGNHTKPLGSDSEGCKSVHTGSGDREDGESCVCGIQEVLLPSRQPQDQHLSV